MPPTLSEAPRALPPPPRGVASLDSGDGRRLALSACAATSDGGLHSPLLRGRIRAGTAAATTAARGSGEGECPRTCRLNPPPPPPPRAEVGDTSPTSLAARLPRTSSASVGGDGGASAPPSAPDSGL